MFHSLQYHRKELLSSFQFNGHTMGFDPKPHWGSASQLKLQSANRFNGLKCDIYCNLLTIQKNNSIYQKRDSKYVKKISKFAQQILGLFSSGLETFKDLRSEREVFREHSMN